MRSGGKEKEKERNLKKIIHYVLLYSSFKIRKRSTGW